ncbi:hypothetical protein Bhyg_12852 [Pseudolycoriella hygida]|uniref:C-type lectin domain-containing protein n=1 Tax=Pseudolycoriella hygida TaxID=35572 RepID=A0A9Q0MYB4_9DIPT|nr:hypothetical protein Bhyg_12852 [Pseudolycoriella hygida]
MKWLILFAFFLIIVATEAQYCPVKYINTDGFIRLGSYNGTNSDCKTYAKTYYLSALYKEKWYKAKDHCEMKGMEFLTLDTLDESNYFMQLFNADRTIISDWVYIGGVSTLSKSLDHWYWLDLGERLNFQPSFAPGQPSGTHISGVLEYCLSVGKVSGSAYYNDIRCNGLDYNFLCQTRDS